jgi:hypothetical protein
MEKKSANKLWKESNTTLSFKEWIERENKKKTENQSGNFLPFNSGLPSDVVKDTLDRSKEQILSTSGYKPEATNQTVLGLDKKILVFSGLLIVGSVGIYFYQKLKSKK